VSPSRELVPVVEDTTFPVESPGSPASSKRSSLSARPWFIDGGVPVHRVESHPEEVVLVTPGEPVPGPEGSYRQGLALRTKRRRRCEIGVQDARVGLVDGVPVPGVGVARVEAQAGQVVPEGPVDDAALLEPLPVDFLHTAAAVGFLRR
jgi:hypothetical protein